MTTRGRRVESGWSHRPRGAESRTDRHLSSSGLDNPPSTHRWGYNDRGRFPGMAEVPPIAWRRPQAVAAQHIPPRGAGGPGPVGMAFPKDREPLLGTPGRRPWACLNHGADDRLRGWIGAAARLARARLEAVGAQPTIALDPLISCVATHAVPLTQLWARQAATSVVGDERCLVVQRCGLTPRHGAPPVVPAGSSHCHRGPWTQLLPRSPDRTKNKPLSFHR
jgi:hypothetical protein